jgi:hypothetical protein
LPGRPNTRYPGSGHPPPRGRPPKFPPDARPPEDHPFGGTLTRAQVLERYQKYGDTPQEELQAYRERLQRIAQGREIGHRQGVSAAQGQGSVSSDQRSTTRGGLVARQPRVGGPDTGKPLIHAPEGKPNQPTFGGPKNGKPNLTRQQILIQLLQRRRAMGRARNL